MKSNDFADTLLRFSDLLGAAEAIAAEDCLRQLKALFEIAPTTSVADIIKKLNAASLNLSTGHPSLKQPAIILGKLRLFLAGQAKPALLFDVSAVEAFLFTHSTASVSALLEAAPAVLVKPAKPKRIPTPVRHDLIDRYTHQLEEALGDEAGFVALFKELSDNPEVGRSEAAEIAKRFAGRSGASKAIALNKVWARHHNLMTFRAKSESRAGRSAA